MTRTPPSASWSSTTASPTTTGWSRCSPTSRATCTVVETDDQGHLLQYVGHGTFIAGLLAAVAPNTNVTVRNTLNDAGAILESDFGQRLFDAVDEHGWPDIISLSAGTSNGRTDGLLGVESFMQALRGQRTLLVAAAGNNASATPFWPAAYASLPDYADVVLSVGALRGDGEYGACFSNHGSWVNAYAPGERLTSALTGFDAPVPYALPALHVRSLPVRLHLRVHLPVPAPHRRVERGRATPRPPGGPGDVRRATRTGAAPRSPLRWPPAWSPPT